MNTDTVHSWVTTLTCTCGREFDSERGCSNHITAQRKKEADARKAATKAEADEAMASAAAKVKAAEAEAKGRAAYAAEIVAYDKQKAAERWVNTGITTITVRDLPNYQRAQLKRLLAGLDFTWKEA